MPKKYANFKFESRARLRDRPHYFVIDSEGNEVGVYSSIGEARNTARNSAAFTGEDYTVLSETEDMSVLDATYGSEGRKKAPNTHALARYYGHQAQAQAMNEVVSTKTV